MWKVVGGSATGRSHIKTGRGCQDSHGWYIGDDVVCLAVADGAGSRPRSAEGSEAAIDAVLTWAAGLEGRVVEANGGERVYLEDAFDAAHASVRSVATELGVLETDLATTLGIVLVHRGEVLCGQVGDSIVVVESTESEMRTVCPAPRFEYANEVTFITSADALGQLRLESLSEEKVQAVALSTDGLRFKILDDLATGRPFVPFFEDVFDYAGSDLSNGAAVASFIDGLSDQTGDDKTLVVAVWCDVDPGPRPLERVRVLNDFLAPPRDQLAPASPSDLHADDVLAGDPAAAEEPVDDDGAWAPEGRT